MSRFFFKLRANQKEMEDQQIKHSTYFEGAVQSLALTTSKGKATVGVMKKGSYTFGTASAEEMVIISGKLTVSLDGETFKDYTENDHFNIAANSSFDVSCEADVAYICYYA